MTVDALLKDVIDKEDFYYKITIEYETHKKIEKTFGTPKAALNHLNLLDGSVRPTVTLFVRVMRGDAMPYSTNRLGRPQLELFSISQKALRTELLARIEALLRQIRNEESGLRLG
jgi:hypothetical protein